MTDRLRTDLLAAAYLAALERPDPDEQARLWAAAAADPGLLAALREVHAGLVEEDAAREHAAAADAVRQAVERHLPSAAIVRRAAGPVTAADVADDLFRHPPAVLPAEAHALTARLRTAADPLPPDLALSKLAAWAEAAFGPAPAGYWAAFHAAALRLELRRASAAEYQLAARATPRPGGAGMIREAVAGLRARVGIPSDPARRGPVPLARFFPELALAHVALPGLTCGGVVAHLRADGHTVEEVGDPAAPLAGFLFAAGRTGVAFVNASDILGRRRFTAAHELGHAVLHRGVMGRYLADADIAEAADAAGIEQEANRFAAELLMPEDVIRAREAELKAELETTVCPRLVLAYRLAAELLVSREAARFRLKALGWAMTTDADAVRRFFAAYVAAPVGPTPDQPRVEPGAEDDSRTDRAVEVPEAGWAPRTVPERPAADGEFPRRFIDGSQAGQPVLCVRSPQGWPVPLVLGEVGAVALAAEGRGFRRVFAAVERGLAFVADPFPWAEVEAFAAALANKPELRLRVLPANLPAEGHSPFDYEVMRTQARARFQQEMTTLERLALAADRRTPTLVDGPLNRVTGAPAPAGPLLVGVAKSQAASYLHDDGWRALLDLRPGQRTPVFKIDGPGVGLPGQFAVASWYVKLAGGPRLAPNWGYVRVEVSWGQFETQFRGDFAFVDRLSRWLIDARCRADSYARMPVSLDPVVRAEDALKPLFTPPPVLVNRLYRAAGLFRGDEA